MTEEKFLMKIVNQIIIAFSILVSSMCIWKISGMIGEDTVYLQIFISFLSILGLSLIIRSLTLMMERYSTWRINTTKSFEEIKFLYVIWIIIMMINLYRGFSASYKTFLGHFMYSRKVTMVNYTYLSNSYMFNSLIVIIIPVILSVLLFRGIPQTVKDKARNITGIVKEMLINYILNMAACMMITAAFLITGEHRSTLIANSALNILYFSILAYMVWYFGIGIKQIILFIKTAGQEEGQKIRVRSGGKKHLLFHAGVYAVIIICSVVIITGYSPEMDFTYLESIRYPGTIEIQEYIGEQHHIKVPGKIDGKPVSSVRLWSREDGMHEFIRTVTIDEGIKKIGNYAFGDCPNLTSVSMPASVTEIDSLAFSGCSKLKEIILPEGLTVIGLQAFIGCTLLEQITIPEGVEEIPEAAFMLCWSLNEVNLPESISALGKESFSWCSHLQVIKIPEKVTVIPEGAFSSCSSLETVFLPEQLKEIEAFAFDDCGRLRELRVYEGIEYIDELAFGTEKPHSEIVLIK